MRNRGEAKKPLPVLVASALMAIPYAHFAYSRADVGHLAQGICPLLIGVLAVAACSARHVRQAIVVVLITASAIVALPLQPGCSAWRDGDWKSARVGRDGLLVDPTTAADLKLVASLAQRYARDGRPFIATPNWPGAYAALERKSPMWEIYALFPRGPAFEREEIERIRSSNPGFAVVMDLALDGRDELRFRNTHPLTDRYIRDHFIPVCDLDLDANLRVYKAVD